jgi:hypothetical protein
MSLTKYIFIDNDSGKYFLYRFSPVSINVLCSPNSKLLGLDTSDEACFNSFLLTFERTIAAAKQK